MPYKVSARNVVIAQNVRNAVDVAVVALTVLTCPRVKPVPTSAARRGQKVAANNRKKTVNLGAKAGVGVAIGASLVVIPVGKDARSVPSVLLDPMMAHPVQPPSRWRKAWSMVQ